MPETVTVRFFNARLRQAEKREHTVTDFERPTIEAVVDLFDAQFGTVLSVWAGDRCLHRSAVQFSDLL